MMYLSILFAMIFPSSLHTRTPRRFFSAGWVNGGFQTGWCWSVLTPSSWLLIFLDIKRFKFPLKCLWRINCLILHAFVCEAVFSNAHSVLLLHPEQHNGGWRPEWSQIWKEGRLRIRKGTNIPSLSSSLLAQFNASNRKKPIHWFGYPLRHFQDALARSPKFPLCNSSSSYTTWLVAGWGWNSLVAVTDKVNPFRTSGSNGKIESYWKSQYWRQTTEE